MYQAVEEATEAGRLRSTGLPLFYDQVLPLSPKLHQDLFVSDRSDFGFASDATALPLVCEEMPVAQRNYPVVFTAAELPMPVALVGVEGAGNRLIDEDGGWQPDRYVPAYLRRYPFLLVRENQEGGSYCLCVDPTSDSVVKKDGPGNLFDGDEPTPFAKRHLDFCVNYEKSLKRTRSFTKRLAALDLFEDGVARIDRDGKRIEVNGFRVVSEAKLARLDEASRTGLMETRDLALIHAHLFSLACFTGLVAHDA